MARRVLAWECRYCGALKKTENICLRHEITCVHNPDAKNCILCIHSNATETGKMRKEKLLCNLGKKCSRAVSAKCENFRRRDGKEEN